MVTFDISSITRDFRDNRLTVLNAGYKKLSKDGDWGGVTACSLSVLHNLSGTILRKGKLLLKFAWKLLLLTKYH